MFDQLTTQEAAELQTELAKAIRKGIDAEFLERSRAGSAIKSGDRLRYIRVAWSLEAMVDDFVDLRRDLMNRAA